MVAKKDLSVNYSQLTQEEVELFCRRYGIDSKYNPAAPSADSSVDQCPASFIALHCRHFEFSNLRYPFSVFVLNVLEYHRVSFGQIHPLGLARVVHFEVLCRALGYDASLLMFRRFFRLAKNGDWYTFERTKGEVSLISSTANTLGVWKDRFFFVSESILPFKPVWRKPEAVMNEPEPHESELDKTFLNRLRVYPSRLRPFPEQLLVLVGLSKLWDKPGSDPVLMKGDQVMSALDFLKSDDTSDVVFKDVEASIDGNVVAKGQDARFEGGDYVSVENVKGFSKAPVPKSITRRSSRKLLKAAATSSSHELADVSDDIQVSDDPDVEVEKEKELEIARKKKAVGKRVVSSSVYGDEVYIPAWKVKSNDLFKTPESCADALAHFAPPAIRDIVSKFDSVALMKRLVTSFANFTPLLAEGVTRFQSGMEEYEQFKTVKDEMNASVSSMKKSLGEYVEKEKGYEEKVKGLIIGHEVEMALLHDEVEKLKVEVGGLKGSLVRANADNKWLIEHGFQQVVAYLLHSGEFNSVLGGVYPKLIAYGNHQGLVAGYDLGKAGEPIEKSPMFNEAAHEQFVQSVNMMEKLTYPYVGAVSACYGKPLSVLQGLKPEGLNEKATQDVLDSLSKKRSHSGDSDETLSGDEGSQAGSLEASAVAASPPAKPKKKNKKVTKVGTSKPPVDV